MLKQFKERLTDAGRLPKAYEGDEYASDCKAANAGSLRARFYPFVAVACGFADFYIVCNLMAEALDTSQYSVMPMLISAAAVAAYLTCAYFFGNLYRSYLAFQEKDKKAAATAFFAVAVVIMAAVSIFRFYMERENFLREAASSAASTTSSLLGSSSSGAGDTSQAIWGSLFTTLLLTMVMLASFAITAGASFFSKDALRERIFEAALHEAPTDKRTYEQAQREAFGFEREKELEAEEKEVVDAAIDKIAVIESYYARMAMVVDPAIAAEIMPKPQDLARVVSLHAQPSEPKPERPEPRSALIGDVANG